MCNPQTKQDLFGKLYFFQITLLCNHLDSLWEENQGCVTLFVWLQFLQDESLTYLGVENTLDVTELIQHSFSIKKQRLEREQM